MGLTSPISSPDDRWPGLFAAERDRIAPGFGEGLVAIHHVGSTAVPGLAAKPEIDLLVVVADHGRAPRVEAFLRGLGYLRGKDLAPGHHFYRRDVGGLRTHKLHACTARHPAIARMLRFRDLLRADPALRRDYEALKLRLEAENREGIAEYLAGKAPFIDALVGAGGSGRE
jgi:GrpB-like predicted nucleotidyltransferase (UPF0157 family)